MTKQIIYVLRCSEGAHEDRIDWVEGVFSTKEKAEEVLNALNLIAEHQGLAKWNPPNIEDYELDGIDINTLIIDKLSQ